MNLWEYIANFINWLLVPPSDYFTHRLSALSDTVNQKLGGVAQLYQQLHYFWSSFDGVTSSSLVFDIPDNFLYAGYQGVSVDFMQGAAPYFSFLSAVLTSAVYIYTAIACYHKLRATFSGGGV